MPLEGDVVRSVFNRFSSTFFVRTRVCQQSRFVLLLQGMECQNLWVCSSPDLFTLLETSDITHTSNKAATKFTMSIMNTGLGLSTLVACKSLLSSSHAPVDFALSALLKLWLKVVSPSDVLGQRHFSACLIVVGVKSLPATSELLQGLRLYRWRVQYNHCNVMIIAVADGTRQISEACLHSLRSENLVQASPNSNVLKLHQTSHSAPKSATQVCYAKSKSIC